MRFFIHLLPLATFLMLAGLAPGESPALIEAENEVHTQRKGSPWTKANPFLPLQVGDLVRTGEFSRAAVRLADQSVDRMDEFTTLEILPVKDSSNESAIDLKQGAIFFFSRERDRKIEISTPAANGALRGTQVHVRVKGGRTEMTVLEGQVLLSNPFGQVTLDSGDLGVATLGTAPRKTAVINAQNLLQWVLYYPAVLNPEELNLTQAEKQRVWDSLQAYQSGNPLKALEVYPKNHRPASSSARAFHAAVLLAVGRLDEAEYELRKVPRDAPAAKALRTMISAVRFETHSELVEPKTAAEWLANSYYLQSRSNLEAARTAATKAVELSPNFSYAWVRLAELELSFGRIAAAKKALAQGLALAPSNAQAYALKGFLLSAENRVLEAKAAFNQAIRLDGALANGWLGRGLTSIRQNEPVPGRQDLQTAATMEPNRSVLFSYLGKAFADSGDFETAGKDLLRAKQLDPQDPTPWLYSALWNKQQNRYNQAISDLQRSMELNDNRQVYRSRFLLDQDLSIRGANLAAIYQENGLEEVSVQEAVRAVNTDYGNASAHLFLANSWDALRDPNRRLLRYESAWFNELLLANLLSPVGAGPLSQFVSQQEYSKMFEADGFGFSSTTDYLGTGELREIASQFGTFGNFSYSLDTEYFYNPGTRFNNSIRRSETYASAKAQLTPDDTLFFQTKFQDYKAEFIDRLYRNKATTPAARTLESRDQQIPGLLLAGYRHTWAPGTHTLATISRLSSDSNSSADRAGASLILTTSNPRDPTTIESISVDLENQVQYEVVSGEVAQILTLDQHTAVAGLRVQRGSLDIQNRYRREGRGSQNESLSVERNSFYLYDTWQITPWLSFTGGLTLDQLTYPENFRNPPIDSGERTTTKILPKAGFILSPTSSFTLRGAYTESLSGVSFDESVRLEPTQVAGFNQAFRTILPEDVGGNVEGATVRALGFSAEQRFPTQTYCSIGYQLYRQDLSRGTGFFEQRFDSPFVVVAADNYTTLPEELRFRENIFTASLHQLLGEEWSLGAGYRYSRARLESEYGGRRGALLASTNRSASLQELDLFTLYNHPSGAFARADAFWFKQDLSGYKHRGDAFWQLNLMAGYRFYRNQCELACGVVNLTNTDYKLEPLNQYAELPRERTFLLRLKVNF